MCTRRRGRREQQRGPRLPRGSRGGGANALPYVQVAVDVAGRQARHAVLAAPGDRRELVRRVNPPRDVHVEQWVLAVRRVEAHRIALRAARGHATA
eukprot:2167071-Prymnesium_polylepis.1